MFDLPQSELQYLPGLFQMGLFFAAFIAFVCVCEWLSERAAKRRQTRQDEYIGRLRRQWAREDARALVRSRREPLSRRDSTQLEAMSALRRQHIAAQIEHGIPNTGE